jgi:hypothetical protein
MPYGGVVAELTRDHARVIKALPTISGRASQQTTDSDRSCRSRDTLNALVAQLEGLARLEGPKSIVFVSSGMLLPRRDAPLSSAPGPCEIRPVQYEQVGRAASLSRAHVYVVRPDDLVIDSARNAFVDPSASRFQSTDEEVAGLESLAGVTNGVLLRLTPTDRSAFARIARESAGYYLVGFEPRPGERNGAYHRVDVDIAKGEARIKALPYLMVAKDEGRKPAGTPTAILRDPKLHPDLALRVVGFSSPNPGDSKLTVVGLVEPFDPSVTLSSAVFGLIDTRGRLVAQWTPSARELASQPVASAGLVSPGRYRLRVAAIDSTGRRGSADYDLSAELVSAGGLTFSTMVLGVSYERSFMPRLQFSREPTANGYFEIFGEPPAGMLSLAMELAATPDGPPLARVPGAIAPLQGTDRRRATGIVPIAQVPAGDYVLRAVLSLDGKPLATLSRVLRKVAP